MLNNFVSLPVELGKIVKFFSLSLSPTINKYDKNALETKLRKIDLRDISYLCNQRRARMEKYDWSIFPSSTFVSNLREIGVYLLGRFTRKLVRKTKGVQKDYTQRVEKNAAVRCSRQYSVYKQSRVFQTILRVFSLYTQRDKITHLIKSLFKYEQINLL